MVRRLARTPGFTLLALATLALGIGANAALFSVVHAVLLKPLPFEEPDGSTRSGRATPRPIATPLTPGVLRLPRPQPHARGGRRPRELDRQPRRRVGHRAAAGPARVGQLLRDARCFGGGRAHAAPSGRHAGNEKVVVLSHGLWLRRFGADPSVVGRPITLNGDAFTVVGVMSREFVFPVRDTDLAIPLAPDLDPLRHNRESTSFLRLVGRARDGVVRAAVADLEGSAPPSEGVPGHLRAQAGRPGPPSRTS